jgi:flavin-dependent dehydrogenase
MKGNWQWFFTKTFTAGLIAPGSRRVGFEPKCIALIASAGEGPRSSIRRTAIADGWVAVGDALMAFDPLCGRGITEALLSGVEVADRLVQFSHTKIEGLPIWATNAAERFNSYCAQRAAIYGAERRWGDMAFWQRRGEVLVTRVDEC